MTCRARVARANSSGRRTIWRPRHRALRQIQNGQDARRSASAMDAMGKSPEHVLNFARPRIGFGKLDRNSAVQGRVGEIEPFACEVDLSKGPIGRTSDTQKPSDSVALC